MKRAGQGGQMRGAPHVWGELSEKSSGASTVEWCRDCHCPVIMAPGAMERHRQRVHVAPAPAKPMPGVQRWEMEWR